MVVASVLRLSVKHGLVHVEISADGVRTAIAIVSFWTIAGLRMALRIARQSAGKLGLPHRPTAGPQGSQHSHAPSRDCQILWALLFGPMSYTFCAWLILLRALAPLELRTWPATCKPSCSRLAAYSLHLLLTDALFLNVKTSRPHWQAATQKAVPTSRSYSSNTSLSFPSSWACRLPWSHVDRGQAAFCTFTACRERRYSRCPLRASRLLPARRERTLQYARPRGRRRRFPP